LTSRYDDDARLREQIGLLVRALRSDSDSVRESAVVQLSLFGVKAVPYLSSALVAAQEENRGSSGSDRSSVERAIGAIVYALGIIADPSAASIVAKALPIPQAVLALGKIGTPTALGLLIQEIPQWYMASGWRGSEKERDALARGAFSYFGQEAVTKLADASKSYRSPTDLRNDEAVGLCACAVLQETKGASAMAGLLDLLESSEPNVRTASFQALTKLEAPIPQQFVTKALEGAFKRPSQDVVDVPLEKLLDASQGDTLLQFYFGWDWEAAPRLSAYSSTGPSWGEELLEYYIAKNASEVKPRLIEYVATGTPSQQKLAVRLLEKITSSDLGKPTPIAGYYASPPPPL